MVADRDRIKAVKHSECVTIVDMQEMTENDVKMIASNDKFSDFRCGMGRIRPINDGEAVISSRLKARLNVEIGDIIRILPI